MYTGIYELGKTKKSRTLIASPIMEQMIIISTEEYEAALEILKKNDSNPSAVRPTRRGSLLLTGILHCDCDHKFTSTRFKRSVQRQNGTIWSYDREAYRCASFNTPKDGQPKCKNKVYTAEIFDGMIIRDAKKFIREFDREKLMQSTKNVLLEQKEELLEQLKKIERQVKQKQKEFQFLKNEVLKVIVGESNFSKDLLSGMISDKETEIREHIAKQDIAKIAVIKVEEDILKRKEVVEELDTWEARFDEQSTMDKKSMLINIIEKIIVYENYIEVIYKIKLRDCEIVIDSVDSAQKDPYNIESCSINDEIDTVAVENGKGDSLLLQIPQKTAFLSTEFVKREQLSTE